MLQEAALTSATRQVDETAIHQIIQDFAAAWSAGDGPASAERFAVDVDYIVWNGMVVKGRQALAEGHQQIFNTIYKGSQIKIDIKSVRFLRDDVAAVRTESILKVPQENTFAEAKATQTFVMTKTGDTWQVDVFQNTLVQPHESNPASRA